MKPGYPADRKKVDVMRLVVSIIAVLLLLTGIASAAEVESPPALLLDHDGIIESPQRAMYSWSYPTGNADEWSCVEACGMAPTDPAVLTTFDHVLLMEDHTYTIQWDGTPPDELIVFSWDIAVFTDQDHTDDYQENAEIVIHKADGKITLKPDRVYSFQAKWLQTEGGDQPYGNAEYYLVTEKLIMEDGPGSIMVGGWTPSSDPTVTDELRVIFEKGTSTLDGAVSIPIAYLGSQVVAGTNHAFLCQTATAYPGMPVDPTYVIVYLYEDLQGNVSILNTADFDIGSLCTYGEE